ncbi:MAG: hypothetical protein AABY22_28840, partial [Nanoarchaeota archaeon]
AQTLADTLTPENVLSRENIGNLAKEGVKEYETNFKKTQNGIYENFLKTRENAKLPAIIGETLRIAEDIVAQGKKDLFVGVDYRIKNLLTKLQKSFETTPVETPPPKITPEIKSVLDELKFAEAGKRIFNKDQGGYLQKVTGQESTFPDWIIGDRLRQTPILQRVIKLYEEGKFPKPRTKEAEVYDLVNQRAKSLQQIDVTKLFEEEKPKIEEAKPQEIVLKPSFTFEYLMRTRTSVGEVLQRNPESADLKRLYGALTRDMDVTLSIKDPLLGNELKLITESYRSGKQRIESNLIQSIERSNPENIAQNIFKKNNATALKTLKEIIGISRFNEISKAYLEDLIKKSYKQGRFDLKTLRKNFNKLDGETLNEIIPFTEKEILFEGMNFLNKNEQLLKALRSGSKVSEGSQTAFLTQTKRLGQEFIAFTVALATGHYTIATGFL